MAVLIFFKSNIIERYCNRPTSIALVDKLCLAEFAYHFYQDYTNRDEMNEAQPDVLTDTVAESQHTDTDSATKLPNKIRLLNTNEVMKCRKIGAVIRFHTPNKQKEPEIFFHHLLMLYFPWRNEVVGLTGTQETYASKFCEPEVQTIVDLNREKFEPDAEAVAEALEFLRNNNLCSLHSYDSLNDQQNEDMQSEWQDNSPLDESFNEQPPEHLAQAVNPVQSREPGSGAVSHNQPSDISDDILRESVRSLDSQQRRAYDTVLTWCRIRVMNMDSLQQNEIHVEPLNLFITGGAGTGNSHTIEAIFRTAVKTFRHAMLNPEMTTVLLVAQTGVAAVNINGTIINSALAIPKDVGDTLPAMSDQKNLGKAVGNCNHGYHLFYFDVKWHHHQNI